MTMVEGIGFFLKAAILTEVLTNAVRSWGIFDRLRAWVKCRSNFLRRLLDCFECTSIWVGTFVACYLMFFEITILSYLLIFSGLARYIHTAYDLLDAKRAVEEGKL
jgi:hypothetical protein